MAFAKTLCSMLLHRTTQCFESLILNAQKQTGVIEKGPFKHLFWTFIVARKSAPQVQISSSGDEKPDHTYAEIPILSRSVEDRDLPSLFVCRHDRRLVPSAPLSSNSCHFYLPKLGSHMQQGRTFEPEHAGDGRTYRERRIFSCNRSLTESASPIAAMTPGWL